MNFYVHPLEINLSETASRNAQVFKERVDALNLKMPCPIEIRISDNTSFNRANYEAKNNHSWIIFLSLSPDAPRQEHHRAMLGNENVLIPLFSIFYLAMGATIPAMKQDLVIGIWSHNRPDRSVPYPTPGWKAAKPFDLLLVDVRTLGGKFYLFDVRGDPNLNTIGVSSYHYPFLWVLFRGMFDLEEFVFDVPPEDGKPAKWKVRADFKQLIDHERVFDSAAAEFLSWLTEPDFHALSVVR